MEQERIITRPPEFVLKADFKWNSPASDEMARQAIRHLIENSDSHQQNGNNQSPQELQESFSLSTFRRFDLLPMLTIKFEGDIAQAVRFAKPELFRKPLLHLDQVKYGDHLWEDWRQRFAEIESRIISTMVLRGQLFNYFFKDRKTGKRGGHTIKRQANEQHWIKKDFGQWRAEENQDLKSLINNLLKPGDAVCSFLSGHDAILPSLILNKTGPEGRICIISPDSYLENGLASAFMKRLVNFQQIKGEGNQNKSAGELKRERVEKKSSGANSIDFINGSFAREANRFLSQPFRSDEGFYMEGFNWQSNGLMEDFFEHFNIRPLRYLLPRFPNEIHHRTLDAIVECDRFSEVPEEAKEEVLYEMDRALKPGGYLIIRENAREQVNIEYYGQELLSKRYRRIRLNGIKSAQLMVFQKLPTGSSHSENANISQVQSQETPPVEKSNLCPETHTWYTTKNPDEKDVYLKGFYHFTLHLLRWKHQVDGEILGGYPINENLRQILSLSWFRKMGLLQPLMSAFGGSVEKTADFIIEQLKLEQNQPKSPSTQPTRKLPEGLEQSYTLTDIAREFHIETAHVRKALRESGIRGIRREGRYGKFTRRSTEARELRFSPEEYLIISETLKRQNLKPEKSPKEDENPNIRTKPHTPKRKNLQSQRLSNKEDKNGQGD